MKLVAKYLQASFFFIYLAKLKYIHYHFIHSNSQVYIGFYDYSILWRIKFLNISFPNRDETLKISLHVFDNFTFFTRTGEPIIMKIKVIVSYF